MPGPEKNASLVVFVSPEGEEGVRLTYARASLKTLADSVCLSTLPLPCLSHVLDIHPSIFIYVQQVRQQRIFQLQDIGLPSLLILGYWPLQIRKSKGWPDRGLRFILAGRELYEDDIIEAAQAPVLHCMVVDESVQGSVRRQHRPPPTADPVDWVRAFPSNPPSVYAGVNHAEKSFQTLPDVLLPAGLFGALHTSIYCCHVGASTSMHLRK